MIGDSGISRKDYLSQFPNFLCASSFFRDDPNFSTFSTEIPSTRFYERTFVNLQFKICVDIKHRNAHHPNYIMFFKLWWFHHPEN
jgi:glycerophosphoryl diester phosphodiesterase